ncbi:MAG: hypothetical protein IT529_02420 [Burkholderiales bacterium]|nr:hypothetical protein [Burkholderiales bacterium]
MRGANAITMIGSRRPDEDARRKAMVRLNGMMFYCAAIASFVESTPPLDTNRLLRLSAEHADARPWLERVWLPGRAGYGRAFRDYIESTWPEFEWADAYEEFRSIYALRTAARVGPPGLALEYVARCATETSLSVFYRTLARTADEPHLRSVAGAAAREHAAYFDYFRGLIERSRGHRRAWLATTCRAAIASCRAAREVDVAAAFDPLGRHWHGGWIFPELSYSEFLGRLARLLRRHGGLGLIERMLFRPWLSPTPTAGVAAPRGAAPSHRPAPGLPRAA